MTLTGTIADYVLVFWAGVLVSFTPCLYPVMPITAGFIAGVNTTGSRSMGFVLSLIYVLGMALTYSALGLFAALTGKIFGQIQNSAAAYIFVGIFLTVFGLMMLDVVKIPYLGLQLKPKEKPKSIRAVFLFGMASGLMVGPCTAPILATLLTYAASKQNMIYSTSLLFVFSYGVGASLILVGTFSGLLSRLPKSGLWLVRIKQASGIILMLAAGYFFYKAWAMVFSA